VKDTIHTMTAGPVARPSAGFVLELAAAGLRAGGGPAAIATIVAGEARLLERFAGLGPDLSIEVRLETRPAGDDGPFQARVSLSGVARGATKERAREAARDLASDLDGLLSDGLDAFEFVPSGAALNVRTAADLVEIARAEDYEGGVFSVTPFRGGAGALREAFEVIAASKVPLTWATILAPARLSPPEETALGELLARAPRESAAAALDALVRSPRLLLGRSFLASPTRVPASVAEAVRVAVGGASRAVLRRPRGDDRTAALADWREHGFGRPADSDAPPALGRLRYLAPAAEALALLPLPLPEENGRVSGFRLPSFRGRSHSIEDPGTGVVVGDAVLRRGTQPVRLRPEDFARHTYVVGKTGTGKSTLLRRLILDDVEAGNGVGVIDPHGDLAEGVLAAIPSRRLDDVVYFDPSDLERPIGLNLLDAETPEEQRLLVSEAVAIFERLYGFEMFGPRIQDTFRNFALTLVDSGLGAALPDLVPLLLPSEFQKSRRAALKDAFLKEFWRQYDEQADRERREMIPYFAAKFSPFYAEPLMRNVMGQTARNLRLGPLMDGRGILIANLAKGAIGEANSRLLGMALVAKVQTAAMMRVRQSAETRVPFRLYVDEFQNYVTPAFSCLLSEGRKYGLTLVLANQFLEQLKKRGFAGAEAVDAFDAIDGSVGNVVAFRVGPKDAQLLAPMLGSGVDPRELVSLPNFHAVASLLERGEPRDPLVLRTERIPAPAPGRGRALASVSRLRHGRSRAIVEAELDRRLRLPKGAA
jgi:hypothetical protein